MTRSRPNGGAGKTQRCLPIFFVVGICCGFFEFGAWQMGGIKGDNLAKIVNGIANCSIKPDLYETHRRKWEIFKPCDSIYTDYTPCQDQRNRTMMIPTEENMEYYERHCPSSSDKKLNCLVPAPLGYVTPFSWPKSRDYVPKTNVQYKNLTIQNWVQLEESVFKFTGGRGTTMFPQGVDAYIEQLASVIPIADGTVRTALDINCGVADWGAYLLKRNVVTMSFAPRDSHDEAQVQFALERGLPAVIGVLGTKKLPYPSASFDMVHCSRCLIPWTSNDGMRMVEADRVLRPGGYWILSGPPINWESYDNNKILEQKLENEHRQIEEYAELLCWEKLYEKADIAVWRKKMNTSSCRNTEYGNSIRSCDSKETDNVWYRNISTCITPWTEASQKQLNKFPERLFTTPPRIISGYIQGMTEKTFGDDNILWKKHIQTYKKINVFLGTVRYRNIMDMNAGLGGFAAAIESPNSWVMNVVPTISKNDTLGIIYERGLIGIYHDWCEAFSTYPRTYDFIHAEDIFSLYKDRCEMEDILVEMDRILRPEGAVIIRDRIDVLNKVLRVTSGIRWNVRIMGGDNGGSDKIIVAVKRYWVGTWK